MIFNSNVFLLFLVATWLLYWLVRGSAAHRNLLILAASFLFYGWWDWRFLGLLLMTGSIDFFVALRIDGAGDARARKRWLWVSLLSNLGTLGLFKYAGFFVDSAAAALAAAGWVVSKPTLSIVLPAGISFYTFQALAYTVDVYRGSVTVERDFVRFFAFLTFFPQLVAGPIERASFLLGQFQKPRHVSQDMVGRGIWLMLWGFFQKVVVADSLAPLVDMVFDAPNVNLRLILLGTAAFGGQIYGDFCGYSTIARGVASTFGFELSPNFAQPYAATDIQEFWRRWHQTLSTWFRDYVYIPLGGDRLGKLRTFQNILLTFALAGLWHGANWTYLLWGLWHGLALGAFRLWKTTRRGLACQLPGWLGWILTMTVVGFGWLLFRARSFSHVMHLLLDPAQGVSPAWEPSYAHAVIPLLLVLALVDCVYRFLPWSRVARWPALQRGALQGAVLLCILARWGRQPPSFIYFQF